MASKPKFTRAQIRARAIRALEDKRGRLTASALVAAAKNPKHPMHNDFIWDDSVAGHKYRVDQARTYIAEVRTVITTSTKQVTSVGYIRDPEAAPHEGYVATAKLRNEHEVAVEAMLTETTRLQAMLERCREIAAALELEGDLDLALGALRELEGRIRKRAAPAPLHVM